MNLDPRTELKTISGRYEWCECCGAWDKVYETLGQELCQTCRDSQEIEINNA